jgi:hypothetical protein
MRPDEEPEVLMRGLSMRTASSIGCFRLRKLCAGFSISDSTKLMKLPERKCGSTGSEAAA